RDPRAPGEGPAGPPGRRGPSFCHGNHPGDRGLSALRRQLRVRVLRPPKGPGRNLAGGVAGTQADRGGKSRNGAPGTSPARAGIVARNRAHRQTKNSCPPPAPCGTAVCSSFNREGVRMEPRFLVVGALLVAFPPLIGW